MKTNQIRPNRVSLWAAGKAVGISQANIPAIIAKNCFFLKKKLMNQLNVSLFLPTVPNVNAKNLKYDTNCWVECPKKAENNNVKTPEDRPKKVTIDPTA